MTPEGKVRTYLKKAVKRAGGEHRKLGWIGRRNAPDEFIFWELRYALDEFATKVVREFPLCAFVECKRLGEVATPAQEREHERLRAGGFHVAVVDSEESIDRLIYQLTGIGAEGSVKSSTED